MHKQQQQYVENLKEKFPTFFKKSKVLEIGSLDINGSIRPLFEGCDYTGIDVGEGEGVDVVALGQDFDAPSDSYDMTISCECFEHNPWWSETLINMIRMTRSGGVVAFTCATTGRPEHGSLKNAPQDSPLTLGWGYYMNVTEKRVRSKVDIDEMFDDYKFEVNEESHDLYFWGIKR